MVWIGPLELYLAKTLGTGLVNCSMRIFSTKDNIVQSTDSTKSIGTVSDCTPLIWREDCPGSVKRGPEGERRVRVGERGREFVFGISLLVYLMLIFLKFNHVLWLGVTGDCGLEWCCSPQLTIYMLWDYVLSPSQITYLIHSYDLQ